MSDVSQDQFSPNRYGSSQGKASGTNRARSEETQQKLIEATIGALVQVGFARTTGVEVCRRAGVTRGALNHHFPVFCDLLIAALNRLYEPFRSDIFETEDLSMVRFVEMGYLRVTQPESKAVIELWLASQNEPDIGPRLSRAINDNFSRVIPIGFFADVEADPKTERLVVVLFELMMALGLGRATSGGKKSAHEDSVYQTMIELAKENDERRALEAQF